MREVKVTHIFIFSHFPNYKLWQKFHQNGLESRKVSFHVPVCPYPPAGGRRQGDMLDLSQGLLCATRIYYLDNKILT